MHRRTVLLTGACAAVFLSAVPGFGGAVAVARSAPHSHGVPVDIRVEGARQTLIAEMALNVEAKRIDLNGNPADACEGTTAAAALQDATHGNWSGTYSSSLGYSVEGILGEEHAFSSPYYWSYWVEGKTATTGVCSTVLKPHMHLLFFAQCSKESVAQCPEGLFEPPVLALSGPSLARAGKSLTLKVAS
ncbi:MAG: hypothetical protein KGJ43_07175, partial [Acidobacteriota bacterium]|nr:hypothetical protein [Acidobacteriota bacterium]